MSLKRQKLLRQTAERGKYAALYRYLTQMGGNEWRTTFAEIEKVLGFELPDSARIHRPWWANQGEKGGHSHALAWEMAGWKTSQVRMVDERLVFVRNYTEGELNSIWQKLIANSDAVEHTDEDDYAPIVALENTATKQSMMFRISMQQIATYTDLGAPSDYGPTTVVYTRVRASEPDAWGPWSGEALEA